MDMKQGVLELSRALAMVSVGEDRAAKAFIVVQEKCPHKCKGERIGFEDVIFTQCSNPQHPFAKNIYPTCQSKECALAQMN